MDLAILLAIMVRSVSWWVQALALNIALMATFGFYHNRSLTCIISENGVRKECHYKVDEYNEPPFDKIVNIVFTQIIWGRIFSFGTVAVRSGSILFHNVVFKGVKQPKQVTQIVLDSKERFG